MQKGQDEHQEPGEWTGWRAQAAGRLVSTLKTKTARGALHHRGMRDSHSSVLTTASGLILLPPSEDTGSELTNMWSLVWDPKLLYGGALAKSQPLVADASHTVGREANTGPTPAACQSAHLSL